jgi:hypothetical protein
LAAHGSGSLRLGGGAGLSAVGHLFRVQCSGLCLGGVHVVRSLGHYLFSAYPRKEPQIRQ